MPTMTKSEPRLSWRERAVARFTRANEHAQRIAKAEAKSRPAPPTLEEMIAADAKAVADELKAIDARISQIDKMLATPARPSLWGGASYETQECKAERSQLRDLRREIEADLTCPIDRDRDGQPLDVRWRMIRKHRAAELRESYWRSSEAARAESDHRRARRLRFSSLRGRHEAEAELGWRNLTTYL